MHSDEEDVDSAYRSGTYASKRSSGASFLDRERERERGEPVLGFEQKAPRRERKSWERDRSGW